MDGRANDLTRLVAIARGARGQAQELRAHRIPRVAILLRLRGVSAAVRLSEWARWARLMRWVLLVR